MKKICPHCGNIFECRNHDILNCNCLSVPLTTENRRYLHDRYPDKCLCMNCLIQLSESNSLTDRPILQTTENY